MLLAAALSKYAAVLLFVVLWVGIALAVRGLLSWLAQQNRDSLGF